MKQAYILRREGRDYQAPDLDTLRSWARDGRVLPSDMVYSPRYQAWYRARDLRELRAVLPAQEPATRSSARQQFWLRKGDQNYATDSLDTILRWASEGNIDPDDYIYHPSYGKWFRAGDSPQLASRFPAHLKERDEPFTGVDLERADSVAQTAVDLKTDQIRAALRSRVPVAPVVEPDPLDVIDPRDTRPLDQDAILLHRQDPEPAVPVVTAIRPKAEPRPTPEPEPEPEITPEPSVQPEPVEAPASPPAMELDEDARFEDPTGVMRLFYDVARVFVVTRDLRPGEFLEAECKLPSTQDDFRGLSKNEIYSTLSQRMEAHLHGPVAGAGTGLAAEHQPGYQLLVSRAEALIEATAAALGVIGQRPPERFVIGNQARPKMTPLEEEAMLRIDAALTGVISVRKRKK